MKVYNAIDRFRPEVLCGWDLTDGAIPELMPAAKMIVRHAFERDPGWWQAAWQMSGDVATQL